MMFTVCEVPGVIKVSRWDNLPRDLVAIETPVGSVVVRLETGQFMSFPPVELTLPTPEEGEDDG